MIIEREIIVNQNINHTWDIIGPQFADAYKWASPVSHSEGSGESFNGSTCSERGCATTMGGLKEKITAYSNETQTITWEAIEGMPSMVKKATNSWTLTVIGVNQTKVVMKMDIQSGGVLGFLMLPILKFQMGNLADDITSDFKYYAENGKPSPKKLKAIKKHQN